MVATRRQQWQAAVNFDVSPYFSTKRLHEQYMVSSGHNKWILCPLVPEDIIQFSVMPAGMKFRFSYELVHQFS